MENDIWVNFKHNTKHITYDKLSDDIKYMLDNLIEDDNIKSEAQFLPISKKMSKSFKRIYLEYLIFKKQHLDAETLYLCCIEHWAYHSYEEQDLRNGKKGELVGIFKYQPEHEDINIYKIGQSYEHKYILLSEKWKKILGYINLSINNGLIIHTIWYNEPRETCKYIKIFFEKWFIPKYNLTINDIELVKLLKE